MKLHVLNPENWITLYADYLYRYTITKVNQVEIAEDLVQDTFLAAYNNKDSFKGEASEKTWLTSILKRKIIDYYRKKSSKGNEYLIGNFFNRDDDKHPGTWKDEHLPNQEIMSDKDLENAELKQALDECIEKLPDKHKVIFALKNLNFMETEDISKELNISSSNIWVMLHRSRIQLRECLQDNWF